MEAKPLPSAPPGGDLSVTALYTCGAWAWARLPGAQLLDHVDARRVFGATNAALRLARPFLAGRHAPSLRHSLVQRHLMIDHLLAESGARVVLEIAAGLSRRGAATTIAHPTMHYVELDRPHVIERKRELLERSEEGRAALTNPRWRLVGGDAADVCLPDLLDLPDLAPAAPLCVIAEGLLMYLDAVAQRGLWQRVRELFATREGTLVFDLVPAEEQPRPGAVGRGLEWAMKRFTGGQAFARDTRSRDDIAREVERAGFTVELIDPSTAPERWQLPFADVPTQQLLFVARPAR